MKRTKLALKRETLVVLDPAVLAQVGGGAGVTDVTKPISCFICPQVSRMLTGRICPRGGQ